jgi:DNA repair protein RecO (recombination protein O)
MLIKTEGIVLQNIKYADKKIISKIYTKDHGLISGNIITGNAPRSKIKLGTILPLNQIEISLTLKQNREVQQITEARTVFIYNELNRDHNKLAIAQFLNEVLCKCLKEHTANAELYQFITGAYKYLDKKENLTNDFHIYFLFELSKFLGFEPHNTFDNNNPYFDTREGKYTHMQLGFPLGFDKNQSMLFLELFDNDLLAKKFTASQRSELLECLLAYYKMHVEGFNELRSYQVLKEVFA